MTFEKQSYSDLQGAHFLCTFSAYSDFIVDVSTAFVAALCVHKHIAGHCKGHMQ